MSQTAEADFLLKSRGTSRDLDAFVVAARFSRDGGGRLRAGRRHGAYRRGRRRRATGVASTVHDGAVLAFAPDPTGDGFISGGDDGKLRRIAADGTRVRRRQASA